jgi:hypothetical protein
VDGSRQALGIDAGALPAHAATITRLAWWMAVQFTNSVSLHRLFKHDAMTIHGASVRLLSSPQNFVMTRDVESQSYQKSYIASHGKFLFPSILAALKRRVDVPREQLGRAGSCCSILKLVLGEP